MFICLNVSLSHPVRSCPVKSRHHGKAPGTAQGLGNTTMFCGDGINDLAALSAADVGMAIGANDAVIAAALSTSQGSVAGQHGNHSFQCSGIHSFFHPFIRSSVHPFMHSLLTVCNIARVCMQCSQPSIHSLITHTFFTLGSGTYSLSKRSLSWQPTSMQMTA